VAEVVQDELLVGGVEPEARWKRGGGVRHDYINLLNSTNSQFYLLLFYDEKWKKRGEREREGF